MNVRYGIIFLVVATVFAIDHVSSEEANAETMVRREADPGSREEIRSCLKSKIPSQAKITDPGVKEALQACLKGKSRFGRNADPSILDVITDLVNKAMDATG